MRATDQLPSASDELLPRAKQRDAELSLPSIPEDDISVSVGETGSTSKEKVDDEKVRK
jgi:hypothetical protein